LRQLLFAATTFGSLGTTPLLVGIGVRLTMIAISIDFIGSAMVRSIGVASTFVVVAPFALLFAASLVIATPRLIATSIIVAPLPIAVVVVGATSFVITSFSILFTSSIVVVAPLAFVVASFFSIVGPVAASSILLSFDIGCRRHSSNIRQYNWCRKTISQQRGENK
jgi:hypothetical protein